MSEIADILERAADLIEPGGAWTQHWFATDRFMKDVSPVHPSACSFCARGAIYRVLDEDPHKQPKPSESALEAFLVIAKIIGADSYEYIEEWNDADGRAQGEVVAKLREAAAAARGES